MSLEIDVLAVGDHSKGGDAIAWRFGNLTGPRDQQLVVVVDGGTKDSGERLVEHIKNRFKTDYVDIVVSTHPDNDHISGLTKVVEGLNVGEIWMNRPWVVKEVTKAAFMAKAAIIENEAFAEAASGASTLEELAEEHGIPIRDAFFTGEPTWEHGEYSLTVLGPSREFYAELVEKMEEKEESATANALMEVAKYAKGLAHRTLEMVDVETLTDPAENATSPSNNSSVILLIRTPDGDALLTADAGVPALEHALSHADVLGVDIRTCKFQQVPHHGSKRNVGPSLLDELIGERGENRSRISTCISAPKKGRPKHPNVRVTNAYIRRGAAVFSTEGSSFCFPLGETPNRADYGPATPLDFVEGETEDDD